MERGEIEFFRNSIMQFCDNTINALEQDMLSTEETIKTKSPKIDLSKIKNISVTQTAIKFFKLLFRAATRIIFMSGIANDVNAGDLDIEVDDIIGNEKSRELQTELKLHKYKYKVLEKLARLYEKIKSRLEYDDEAVIRFADSLYQAKDICDRHKHNDYKMILAFLYTCNMINKTDYKKYVIIEDLYREVPAIEKYKFKFPAREYTDSLFKNYKDTYGRKYENAAKQK